jgi:hypothetical protein
VSARSRPARPFASRSSAAAAEAVLSASARAFRGAQSLAVIEALDAAIARIEDDPSWGPGRFIAPANAPHPGYIVDLSVRGYSIVYRVTDRGATVLIPSIGEVFIG